MLGQQQQGAALLQLEPASSSSMLATQAEQSSFSSFKSLLSMIDTHGNLKCPPEPKTLLLSSPTSIVKSFMSLTPTKHKAISDWFSTGNKSSTLGEPEGVEKEPGVVPSASDIYTELLMLAHYKQYVLIPLSTAKNRKYICVYIMDVLLAIFGKEENLEEAEWCDAVHFYLEFMTRISDQAFLQRWKNHFNFFILQSDVKRNLPAYLCLDIKLRKQYHGQRFAFSCALYLEDVRKSKDKIAEKDKTKAKKEAACDKAQRKARDAAERRRQESSSSLGSWFYLGQGSF
ncbi:hypothetical protein CPB85DRAFT_1434218 [Mucidula mucida]|nr:hypothetical protein CPB85DRAFT_1434218 [Mucidula mucida]